MADPGSSTLTERQALVALELVWEREDGRSISGLGPGTAPSGATPLFDGKRPGSCVMGEEFYCVELRRGASEIFSAGSRAVAH